MQEISKVTSVLKNENNSKKLYITFLDRAGEETTVKMAMIPARELIKQLFRHVDPNWGGKRKGAGKGK